MAPAASCLGRTLDLPALILSNCATFAGPKAIVSIATAVDDCGKWKAFVLEARKGVRETLLSADGDSLMSALEELALQSSRAVHNFSISNGLGYPRQFRLREEEPESARDDAVSETEDESGEMSVSVVSVEEPNTATQRLNASVCSRDSPQPPNSPAHRALTPTPPAAALGLLPKQLQAPRPKASKELTACLVVNWVGHHNVKVLTRVHPSARAVEAKAIQLLLEKFCKEDEEDASQLTLRAELRRVHLGGENFELDGDMDNDLSCLFSVGEIPRLDVQVISA